MRICDHQDAVCGNLSAAPPFRLTQFYISWQTNCLRDMCAPQIVYDAFELSFKQGAKRISETSQKLGSSEVLRTTNSIMANLMG